MKHWELVHDESYKGFTIRCYVAPCDDAPEDFHEEGDDAIRLIREGVYAWFDVRVSAFRNGVHLADDYLGACCYENASEFVRETDGCYGDMRERAVTDATLIISSLTMPELTEGAA